MSPAASWKGGEGRPATHLDFALLGGQLQGREALQVGDVLKLHGGAEVGSSLEEAVVHLDHQFAILSRVVCDHHQGMQDRVAQ